MCIVYEAEQASLSRHVAVKVLPPSNLHRPVMLQRFEREAQTAARLHHTNIVPVFGVGDHSSPSVLIRTISAESPIRPRALNPEIPRDLETIVLKAAAREPEHRYRSAEELADDLQRFLDDRPIRARRSTMIERLWRWSRRNRALAGLAGLAVALLILVAVVASVGYVRTRIANHQVRDALAREAHERQIAETQRQKAETLSALTLAALDDIFEQFVPNRVAVYQHTVKRPKLRPRYLFGMACTPRFPPHCTFPRSHSSVLKGEAGRSAPLYSVHSGLSAHA